MTRHVLSSQITSERVRISLVSLMAAVALSACATDRLTEPTSSSQREPVATATVVPMSKICMLTPGKLPDLIVTALRTGTPTSAGVVPVKASIKNNGAGCATPFRIEGQEWLYSGLIAARLDVDPSPDVDASGFTLRSIAPGETLTISGRITVPVFAHNEYAVFNILVDGCAYVGDEFFPTHCRVAESNEDNNFAQAIVKVP